MKYINADLIKELMKRSIALQGNCEYALWLQTVDNYVENLPSIDIDSRGHETMSDKVWCSKCRYFYRDFKYGLSCYRLMDNEPCKYEERKTEPTSSEMEQVDKDINVRSKTEPQTLDDIGKQIQDAYDKGFLSDADAVQAWYEAVKDEPQTDCPWK